VEPAESKQEAVLEAKTRNMKKTNTLIILTCVLSTVGLPMAFGQEQDELRQDHGRCERIKVHYALQFVNTNCPSPIGLCAAGVIAGNQLVSGTMFVNILGLAPSIGLPGIEPETDLSIAAERTITTSHGTLMLRVAAVFDSARGEFAEINRVTGGTGTFEGATGTLWTTGTGTTFFRGQATGKICTNRP
jgi:hypothetical protein